MPATSAGCAAQEKGMTSGSPRAQWPVAAFRDKV